MNEVVLERNIFRSLYARIKDGEIEIIRTSSK